MSNLKKYNLLTLDPMYSPLHNRIANLVAVKRYAVISCVAKRIYLSGFDTYLAVRLIRDIKIQDNPHKELIFSEIKNMNSYHHAYVNKIEKRDLSQTEIRYMARYYVAIESFILKHGINLVIMHNDQRWYHAITILICQKHNIQYIVTEQGLIRPHTTVLDNVGVNANSSISKYKEKIFSCTEDNLPKFKVTSKHDSKIAVVFFFGFMLIFLIERLFKSKTIIRYMHNNYRFSKYFRRVKSKVEFKIFNKNKKNNYFGKINKPYVLLLLQLENDSQILVHSEFSNNQQLIDAFQQQFESIDVSIYIKKHPLDMNDYAIGKNTNFIDGDIKTLSLKAHAVFTVNSSGALAVIKTNTPLFLLGESIYAHKGVAKFININDLFKYEEHLTVNKNRRKLFLNHINNQYLVSGAGWSYKDNVLTQKLSRLLKNN